MKKLLCVFFASALAVLPGCGAGLPPELSQRLIIEAIGVDKTENGFAVTVQALNDLAAGTEDGAPEDGATKYYTFHGTTVAEALSEASDETGLTPLYSQTRLLVLGYETARDALCEALDFFLRGRNTRSNIPVAIATGPAAEIVAADFGKNRVGADVLTDLLTVGEENGTALHVPLYRFVSLLLSETDAACCPLLASKDSASAGDGKAEGGAECIGTVLFNGTKIGTVLSEEETTALLLLTEKTNNASLPVPLENKTFTLRFMRTTTRIRAEQTGEGFRFSLRIAADCDVTEVTATELTQLTPEEIQRAADAASRQLTETVTAALQTCFYDNGCDVCRFRQRLRLLHSLRYRALAEQDRLSPADLPCDIVCEVSIRRTGKEVLRQ